MSGGIPRLVDAGMLAIITVASAIMNAGKIATTAPISLVSNFAKKPFDSLQLGLALDGATRR